MQALQPSRTKGPFGLVTKGDPPKAMHTRSQRLKSTKRLLSYLTPSPVFFRVDQQYRSTRRSRRSVTIAQGTHPIPSRTRKLSPAARMVLPGPPGGRVRRRRPHIEQPPSTHVRGGCLRWGYFPHATMRPVGETVRRPSSSRRTPGPRAGRGET